VRLVGTASRKVGETENGGVRLVGTASRKVGETENGGVRLVGTASRKVGETENGGVRLDLQHFLTIQRQRHPTHCHVRLRRP
jgi:hypothetical protein